MAFDPPPGEAVALEDGLVRIVAPNPSPMTFRGTNTYLLGHDSLAVIDPGPDDRAHLDAILRAVKGRAVSHIVVTHSHLDHSGLARALARTTGAPVLAFGDRLAGRSAVMADLARSGMTGGGEGVDEGFAPDVTVADGEVIAGEGWQLRVLHSPGHFGNHICLGWQGAAFSGDHVMGWSSTLVSPPDGDLTDFMASCHRLRAMGARRLYPGHGAPVDDPAATIDALIAHRHAREGQILAGLADGPASAYDLTPRIYTDVSTRLWPIATRNVLAHLIDLEQKATITRLSPPGPEALYARP